MKYLKRVTIIVFFCNFILAQAIEVNPATLDFGNVLMGNTPSMTFTLTANLSQTVTITPPTYYSLSDSSLTMTSGDSTIITVTFNPPQIGNFNSYVTLTGSTFGSAAVQVLATAVNNIEGSLSGVINADYSPYEITGDISVLAGDTLIIEAGVELQFSDFYSFDVFGTLKVNGDPDSLIHMNSSAENTIGWRGLYFEDSDSSFMQYVVIEDVGFFVEDDMENAVMGVNWAIDGSSSSWSVIEYSNANAHSEDTSIRLSWDNSQNNNTWGYSRITLVENPLIQRNMKISFWYYSYSLSDGETKLYINNQSFWEASSSTCNGYWCYIEINIDESSNFSNAYGDGNSYPDIDIEVRSRYCTPSRYVYIDDFQITANNDAAVEMLDSDITILNSAFVNNNSNGIIMKDSELILDHSIIYQNSGHAFIALNSFPLISNSIIYQNGQYSVINGLGSTSIMFSSLEANASFLGGYCTGYEYYTQGPCESAYDSYNNFSWIADQTPNIAEYNTVNFTPLLNDDLTLDQYSPCIDAANPQENDACLPPGLGTLIADIGMFGGENNCGASGSNMPDGLPIIDNIQDLPQDQGGYVGIQYQGSIYDYGHDAYAITHYYFWREMEFDGSDEEYWEWVGEMPAEGFENYGYSAPTLADSTASGGIYWSKYLVVAHTDNDDIFFVSLPDSGYSVDNIAPYAPLTVEIETSADGVAITWEDTENPDILYYDIYKNGIAFLQVSEPAFEDEYTVGSLAEYTIRGVDENENVGPFSEAFTVYGGNLGDVNWDGGIDVLDILRIADIILHPEGNYNDNELWAAEVVIDGSIDILDLLQIVDIIMGGSGRRAVATSAEEATIFVQGSRIFLTSEAPIAGLQLEFEDAITTVLNQTALELTYANDLLLLYSMHKEGIAGQMVPILNVQSTDQIGRIIAGDINGNKVNVKLQVIPEEYAVSQNYPNPFNPVTRVNISLPEASKIQAVVYDLRGHMVNVLVNDQYTPGYHELSWDGKNGQGQQVASGIYFIHVRTDGFDKTIKATLLR